MTKKKPNKTFVAVCRKDERVTFFVRPLVRHEIHGTITHGWCLTDHTYRIWGGDFPTLKKLNKEYKIVGELVK